MTLKLRLPTSRFRRRGGGDRGRHDQLPNASDDSKTSTKTPSLSSGASSSCSSSSYQPRPPLPTIIASNVTPSTSNATDTPPTSTIDPSVASFPPQQPPAAALLYLPHLATSSTIIAHGTQTHAPSARRSSWRSTSLGSMRSINEDAELLSDSDDIDFGDNRVKQSVADDNNGEGQMSSDSRFPFLSYRASSNSSLTRVSSCPCPATTSSSSLISKREVREEKIRRKNFEARRREFATGNPRRLSDDGRSTSSGEEDPRLIRRRRQSVDFLREESQAAAMNGDDDDDDCYYCHHGERCLEKYRSRPSSSSSLGDSSDQRRVHAENAPTRHRRRATMPSDAATSANQTLIDLYYGEQARPFSHDEDDCSHTSNADSSSSSSGIAHQQSPTTTTATSDVHARRSSMPISITEDEGDEECTVGNSPSHSNASGSRNGGSVGLLEDLEGRGFLKVQNAGLAGALLYYDTEHRRLGL